MATFPIVAVEGSVRAGKTTLCRGIASSWRGPVVKIPDYADCVGPSQLPHPEPEGLDEDARGIGALLDIEQQRFVCRPSFFRPSTLGLIDRSILTVAAHRAGLDAVNGVDVFEEQAMRILHTSKIAVWPTHLIYLDLPHSELIRRHGTRAQDIFTDRVFVDGCRDYFKRHSRRHGDQIEVLWLDATDSPAGIVERALVFLQREAGIHQLTQQALAGALSADSAPGCGQDRCNERPAR